MFSVNILSTTLRYGTQRPAAAALGSGIQSGMAVAQKALYDPRSIAAISAGYQIMQGAFRSEAPSTVWEMRGALVNTAYDLVDKYDFTLDFDMLDSGNDMHANEIDVSAESTGEIGD